MRITRSFEIDYGHRLKNHESKCKNAHGHRGRFDVTVSAEDLDHVGRVIDFGVVKREVGGWLNEAFDHGFIAEEGDPIAAFLQAEGSKVIVLEVPPSIEHLTRLVHEGATRVMLPHGIRVEAVRGYETPTCWADYP